MANKIGMPVAKLDKKTNEVIEEYTSITEAAEKNWTECDQIRRALENSNYTCVGYKWKRLKEKRKSK